VLLLVRRIVYQSRAQHGRRDTGLLVGARDAPADSGAQSSTAAPEAGPRGADAGPRGADAGPPPASDAQPARSSGDHLSKLLYGKPKPGEIHINSTPAGLVFLNGEEVKATPLVAKIELGEKVIVAIVAKGYKLYREVFEPSPNRGIEIHAQLEPASYPRARGRHRGVLNILCHKTDRRRISLDGEDTGYSCPRVGFFLRPGRHKIGLYTPRGDRRKVYRVTIRRGRRRIFRPPRPR
jgi:hypothetical protein